MSVVVPRNAGSLRERRSRRGEDSMRLRSVLGSIGLSCLMAAGASAQWLDDFDGYVPGPLAAQSLWEEWYGSSGVDPNVVNTISFTASNSVEIVTDNDVVYDFTNLAGGRPSS